MNVIKKIKGRGHFLRPYSSDWILLLLDGTKKKKSLNVKCRYLSFHYSNNILHYYIAYFHIEYVIIKHHRRSNNNVFVCYMRGYMFAIFVCSEKLQFYIFMYFFFVSWKEIVNINYKLIYYNIGGCKYRCYILGCNRYSFWLWYNMLSLFLNWCFFLISMI